MAVSSGRPAPFTARAISILVVLIAAAVGVFAVLVRESRAWAVRPQIESTSVVSLGDPFVFPVTGPERMRIRLAVELAHGRENLREAVESRRDRLRSIVNIEVLGRVRSEDLKRGDALIETIRLAVRERINRELQAQLGERDVIRGVDVIDVDPGGK